MKLVALALAISVSGCATTGGKVSAAIAGAATLATVGNAFRGLGCDDDDRACRDNVRTTGIVIGVVGVAAAVTAIVLEVHHASHDTTRVIE